MYVYNVFASCVSERARVYMLLQHNTAQPLEKSYLVRCGQNALGFNGVGEERAGKATRGELHDAQLQLDHRLHCVCCKL
jgi:hypothetical protein